MRHEGDSPVLEAWRKLGSMVKVSGPFPVKFEFDYAHPRASEMEYLNEVECTAVLSTYDRDNTFKATKVFQKCRLYGEPNLHYLRDLAQQLYLHELDEFFTVNGERPFDPHRNETAR